MTSGWGSGLGKLLMIQRWNLRGTREQNKAYRPFGVVLPKMKRSRSPCWWKPLPSTGLSSSLLLTNFSQATYYVPSTDCELREGRIQANKIPVSYETMPLHYMHLNALNGLNYSHLYSIPFPPQSIIHLTYWAHPSHDNSVKGETWSLESL